MLNGIPSCFSPALMCILLEMGHGDAVVLAGGDFPAANMAQRLVRAHGHNVSTLLDAVLPFLPLDNFVSHPVAFMTVVPGHDYQPTIWPTYLDIIRPHDSRVQ